MKPNRKGVRQVAYLPDHLHKMLRLKAARERVSRTSIVIVALQQYLRDSQTRTKFAGAAN
jgi:hypothetical protein